MKINIREVVKSKKLKNVYVFKITTMEGDADDYHKFTIKVDNEKDVKKLIRYCKVLEKAYPNGKGGCDDYDDLEFFPEWFGDSWFSYEDMINSFESWKLFYYDENGDKHKVDYKLSKKDKKIINSYPVLNY